MDLDLDDLDFDTDKVKGFLKHKLEEIQANNARLERTIAERKRHLQTISNNKEDDMDESSMGITFTWTKIFNGRYAFGFTLQNDSGKILKKPRCFLKWTSHKPLLYEFRIFDVKVDNTIGDSFKCEEKDCKLITRTISITKLVHSLAYLVFVVDIPSFTDSLCIEFSGTLICDKEGEEIKIVIPEVSVSPGDATNRKLCDWLVTDGDKYNLLAVLCTSSKIDLLLVLPEHWSSSTDSTFEIHCSLRKIELIESCKNYYVAHGLSQLIDGSIVEIHPSPKNPTLHHMKIYYRMEDSLIHLLHHLHQTITGVTILPIVLYDSFLLQNSKDSSESEVLVEFNSSVKKEIKMVENFLKSSENSHRSVDGDLSEFKSSLTNLESQTDFIYLKICNLDNTSGIYSE